VDARLKNVSQLAGFAKRYDFESVLHELCDIDYVHLQELTATQKTLDRYGKYKGDGKGATELVHNPFTNHLYVARHALRRFLVC